MSRNRFLAAALLALGSAALHVVVLGLGGGAWLLSMGLGALVWSLFGVGLLCEARALAYLVFPVALAGGCIAFGFALTTPAPIGPALGVMAAVDWVVALVLFRLLWSAGSGRRASALENRVRLGA